MPENVASISARIFGVSAGVSAVFSAGISAFISAIRQFDRHFGGQAGRQVGGGGTGAVWDRYVRKAVVVRLSIYSVVALWVV